MESITEKSFFDNLTLGRRLREEGKRDSSIRQFEQTLSFISKVDDPHLYNILLNEIETTKGKIVLESKPRRLGVTLTTRCNLSCVMCEIRKNPWDIPEKTIKEICEYLPHLQYIMWLGGEVFYSHYFEEVLEKAASYPNLKQAIFTNGVLIDEKWAKKLVRGNIILSYSIDGFTKSTYESIRKGARFKDLLKSIDIVNKYNGRKKNSNDAKKKIVKGINYTVMQSNYREIEKSLEFAKRYDFGLLTINFMHVNNPEDIFLRRDPEAAEYIEKAISRVIKKAKDYGIRLNTWIPQAGHSSSSCYGINLQNEQKPNKYSTVKLSKTNSVLCYLPWRHLFIDPGGSVKPFCLCRETVGDIYGSSLNEIWNSRMMQLYRQKILDNNCTNFCNYRCVDGVISEDELKKDD